MVIAMCKRLIAARKVLGSKNSIFSQKVENKNLDQTFKLNEVELMIIIKIPCIFTVSYTHLTLPTKRIV